MVAFIRKLLIFFSLSLSTQAGVITPQQFGARADGIHDDTKAIQSALNCRGKVFLSAGVYRVSGKLMVYSGTQLYGEKGSCIKQTKDAFILYNEHAQVQVAKWDSDISISNITFDGSAVDARSEYTAGIYMCGVRRLTVYNCSLKDIGGDGIYLGRGGKERYCENVRIDNCIFTNCGRNAANPRQSIAVVFAEDVKIADCTMINKRKTSYGVDVEPNKPDEHCSVIVSNCRMKGCGISCGGNKTARRKIIVTNCNIDCSGTENATLVVVKAEAKITGNTIVSNGKQNGITIVTSPSAIVQKNNISESSAGVLITDGSDNVIVQGNRIENCSSGVYVMKSRAIAILSNVLSTRGKGVYVRMESEGTRVERNTIYAESGVDVYTKESANIRVRRNKKKK